MTPMGNHGSSVFRKTPSFPQTGKWSKEQYSLDLEGDSLGHSHADSGPQDAVSTDLPLSTVLHHSPKET